MTTCKEYPSDKKIIEACNKYAKEKYGMDYDADECDAENIREAMSDGLSFPDAVIAVIDACCTIDDDYYEDEDIDEDPDPEDDYSEKGAIAKLLKNIDVYLQAFIKNSVKIGVFLCFTIDICTSLLYNEIIKNKGRGGKNE